MSALICTEDEIIETHVVGQKFKEGVFIAEIYEYDKDEDIFDLAIQENNPDDKNFKHWTQYIVGINTNDVFVSDGNVVFRNNITGEIMSTNETIVKIADDVLVLKVQDPTLLLASNMVLPEGEYNA